MVSPFTDGSTTIGPTSNILLIRVKRWFPEEMVFLKFSLIIGSILTVKLLSILRFLTFHLTAKISALGINKIPNKLIWKNNWDIINLWIKSQSQFNSQIPDLSWFISSEPLFSWYFQLFWISFKNNYVFK